MEVILLETIQNVGALGDLVNVKNGYARNYLIPQKKAVLASGDARAKVEARQRELAEEESKRIENARAREQLMVREISLTRLCSEEGKLYGSVSPIDIAEEMTQAGSRIEKAEVQQPDGPIKHTGEFAVEIVLHAEVQFSIKVNVLGDQSDSGMADPNVDDPNAESAAETVQEPAKEPDQD